MWFLPFAMLLCGVWPVRAQDARIPVLMWEPRSDWTNVRELGARGDGVADDAAAITAFAQEGDRVPRQVSAAGSAANGLFVGDAEQLFIDDLFFDTRQGMQIPYHGNH